MPDSMMSYKGTLRVKLCDNEALDLPPFLRSTDVVPIDRPVSVQLMKFGNAVLKLSMSFKYCLVMNTYIKSIYHI